MFGDEMTMKQMWMIAFLIFAIASSVTAGATNESVYAKAKAQSDIIIDCTVAEEGPLGCGTSVQKSYKVTFKALYWALVGVDFPDTIWIHFDSQEYPQELRGGHETDRHKGDRFIAFVDWRQEKKGWEFRIVRTDAVGKSDEIKKELKLNTEPDAPANGASPRR